MTQLKFFATLLTAAVLTVGLTACGGDDGADTTTAAGGAVETGPTETTPAEPATTDQAPSVPTIVVKGGAPVGGVAELEYGAGEEVRFRVRSDVADEIHVHGYDVSEEVPAGGQVSFAFAADIEGIFEVELEERGEQIAEIRVNP
jgi:hypothetical protein